MPLDESEWDDAESIPTLLELVHDVLHESPSQAFSIEEIVQEVTGESLEDIHERDEEQDLGGQYNIIADILVEQGRAEIRNVTEKDERGIEVSKRYYRATQ